MKGREKGVGNYWQTPPEFFNLLDARFNFKIDAAACFSNTKCERYFDVTKNAFTQDWNASTFCNPPYSLDGGKWRCPITEDKCAGLYAWNRKAHYECMRHQVPVVLLSLANTISKHFRFAMDCAAEVHLCWPRIAFINPITGLPQEQPMQDNAVVVYLPDHKGPARLTYLDWQDEIARQKAA